MRIDDKVTARMTNNSVAFGRLCANVWKRNGIKLDTNLKVYKAVVLPALLYACEICSIPVSCKETSPFPLKLFEKAVIHQAARQDSRPGGPEESRDSVLKLAQLRWIRHVIRMPDERLPKTVFLVIYGELQEGKRSQDGQEKCYIETLKASLKYFDIPMGS